ncbi:MAG: SWIM zinc finger family protein, partial [Chloroflexi bacterium]|nr:SWIM zinc finger family protein [Chloroflexota bacterium]
EAAGKRHIQRIWLWGQHSDQPAQIVHVVRGLRNVATGLVNGTVLEAKLRYFASATPLRAQISERFQTSQPRKPVIGYTTILAAATAYSEALAVNPWLRRFPMALTAVIPQHDGENWFVRDEDGRLLPLLADTQQGWHLRALSGGRPLPLFGVWDGSALTPLTVWSENRWLPLHMLRGIK